MSMRTFFLCWLFGFGLSHMSIGQAAEDQVFDCVRYAKNAKDLIVDSECVARGLRNGADPNWIKVDEDGSATTLSHYVLRISFARDPEVIAKGEKAVRALIDAGAKLQDGDERALYWPIAQGNKSLVRMLLELGASASNWPDEKMGTEMSPVELAAAEGHNEIVELLVKNGASQPSSKVALQERFVRAARMENKEHLSALLSKGARINGKNQDNETALINSFFLVAGSDCKALRKIRWLLAEGADPNLSGEGMFIEGPPLHEAVWHTAIGHDAERATVCSEKILRSLIEHGAHVAARDSAGRTPLHVAALRNHVEAARVLLEAGSKVMPRDKQDRTPLEIAESSEMIRLLKEYGAKERW